MQDLQRRRPQFVDDITHRISIVRLGEVLRLPAPQTSGAKRLLQHAATALAE
jgi:hypothetical protein